MHMWVQRSSLALIFRVSQLLTEGLMNGGRKRMAFSVQKRTVKKKTLGPSKNGYRSCADNTCWYVTVLWRPTLESGARCWRRTEGGFLRGISQGFQVYLRTTWGPRDEESCSWPCRVVLKSPGSHPGIRLLQGVPAFCPPSENAPWCNRASEWLRKHVPKKLPPESVDLDSCPKTHPN